MNLKLMLLILLTMRGLSKSQENCTRTGDLRLVGGRSEREGRVEVCYNAQWSTVQTIVTAINTSLVMCRQLGFQQNGSLPFVLKEAYFEEGSGPVLTTINCNREENRLVDCIREAEHGTTGGIWTSEGSHKYDVGLICPDNCTDGELRSVGFDDSGGPQLEICYRGLWGTACENPDTDISGTELVVICREIFLQRDGEVWNDTQGQICTCPIEYEKKCEGIESWTLVFPQKVSQFNNIANCGTEGTFQITDCLGKCDEDLPHGWESCIYNESFLMYETNGGSNDTQSQNCTCPTGFRMSGNKCEDIDECCHSQPEPTCSDSTVCANGPGGYLCVHCNQGFQPNGIQCINSSNNQQTITTIQSISEAVQPSMIATPDDPGITFFLVVVAPLSLLIVVFVTVMVALVLCAIVRRKKYQPHTTPNISMVNDFPNPTYDVEDLGTVNMPDTNVSSNNLLYNSPVYAEVTEPTRTAPLRYNISDTTIETTDSISLNELAVGPSVELHSLLVPTTTPKQSSGTSTSQTPYYEEIKLKEVPQTQKLFLDSTSSLQSSLSDSSEDASFTSDSQYDDLSIHHDRLQPRLLKQTGHGLSLPNCQNISDSQDKSVSWSTHSKTGIQDNSSYNTSALHEPSHLYATLEPPQRSPVILPTRARNFQIPIASPGMSSRDETPHFYATLEPQVGLTGTRPTRAGNFHFHAASPSLKTASSSPPPLNGKPVSKFTLPLEAERENSEDETPSSPIVAPPNTSSNIHELPSSPHFYATLEPRVGLTGTHPSRAGNFHFPAASPDLKTASPPLNCKRVSKFTLLLEAERENISSNDETPSSLHDVPHTTTRSTHELPNSPHLHATLQTLNLNHTRKPFSSSPPTHCGRTGSNSLPNTPTSYKNTERHFSLLAKTTHRVQPYRVPAKKTTDSNSAAYGSLDTLNRCATLVPFPPKLKVKDTTVTPHEKTVQTEAVDVDNAEERHSHPVHRKQ